MKLVKYTTGLILALSFTSAIAGESPGWYFRADLGYSNPEGADIKDKTPDPTGATSFANLCDGAGSCNFNLDDIDNSSALSLGIGYRYNRNLRVDFTGTHRSGFELNDSIASAFGGNDNHDADIDVTTFMITGYYDFQVQSDKFRPYIGAGIGVSRNKIGRTTVTNAVGLLNRSHSGSTENDTAWQLTAGVTIPMKNNKSIDISYKYIDAGNIDSGSTTISGTAGGAAFGPSAFAGVKGDIELHEISIGLRF